MTPVERLRAQLGAYRLEQSLLRDPLSFEAHHPCSARRTEIDEKLNDNTVLAFGGAHAREEARFPALQPRVTLKTPIEGFKRFTRSAKPREGSAEGDHAHDELLDPRGASAAVEVKAPAEVPLADPGDVLSDAAADEVRVNARAFVEGMSFGTMDKFLKALASSPTKTTKLRLQREVIGDIAFTLHSENRVGRYVAPSDEKEKFEANKSVIRTVAQLFFAGLDSATRTFMGVFLLNDGSLAGDLRSSCANAVGGGND